MVLEGAVDAGRAAQPNPSPVLEGDVGEEDGFFLDPVLLYFRSAPPAVRAEASRHGRVPVVRLDAGECSGLVHDALLALRARCLDVIVQTSSLQGNLITFMRVFILVVESFCGEECA